MKQKLMINFFYIEDGMMTFSSFLLLCYESLTMWII